MTRLYKALSILILTALACTFPAYSGSISAPVAISQLLVTPNPNATATATPFQPLPPTATLPATPTPAGPVIPENNDGTPVPLTHELPRPEGQVNILVLGSDWRPGSGFRTDVILLISINPKENTVKTVSFPRDLYVSIPGRGMDRLNTAQPYGGFELMAETMEYNFGVRPDHYIMTNFRGFIGIVDNLGGIYVDTSNGLTDRCDLPQSYDGYCSVGPGQVYMDGATALWYVRSRYSTNDFDRTHRSQETLRAIFQRLLSFNVVERAPELFALYRNSVETDLTLEDVLALAPIAPTLLEPGRIQQFFIGPNECSDTILPESGAQVLLPDQAAIWEIIRQAIFTSP